MKRTLREAMASPILSDDLAEKNTSGVGIILGTVAAILYSLKAIFVKLAYQPADGIDQCPPMSSDLQKIKRLAKSRRQDK